MITLASLTVISNLEIGESEKTKVIDAFEQKITGYEVFPRITVNNKLYLTTLDYWSECITIGQAFSKGDLPFINRPAGKYAYENICDDVKGSMIDNSGKYYSYPQYIHGDAAVVKIMLKFTSLKTGKVILLISLIFVMFLIVYALQKNSKLISAIYFIYFFMLTDLVFQGFSLAHGIASFWALTICLVIYWNVLKGGKLFYSYSLIGGSGYAILSMMHNPIQYIGLVGMISFIGLYMHGLDRQAAAKKSFLISIFWGVGGFLTMITHWLIVSRFSESETLGKALNYGFTQRMQINIYDSIYIFFGLLRVHIFNFSITMFGLLLMMFIFGYASKRNMNNKKINFKTYIYLYFPTLTTIIWFIFMTGHIGHGWTINLLFTSLLNVVSVIYIIKNWPDYQVDNLDSIISRKV